MSANSAVNTLATQKFCSAARSEEHLEFRSVPSRHASQVAGLQQLPRRRGSLCRSERKRDASQGVHLHSRRNRYRRHWGNLHCSVAHDMQPSIFAVVRSTTSLQNPTLRPSMIVRMVDFKPMTAVRTSCVSRAFASVSPAQAYSGSVNPAVVFTLCSSRTVDPRTAFVAATKPSWYCRRNKHEATGHVASGEDMGRRGSQAVIDLHEPSIVGQNTPKRRKSACSYSPPNPPQRQPLQPRRLTACRSSRSSSALQPRSSRRS